MFPIVTVFTYAECRVAAKIPWATEFHLAHSMVSKQEIQQDEFIYFLEHGTPFPALLM